MQPFTPMTMYLEPEKPGNQYTFAEGEPITILTSITTYHTEKLGVFAMRLHDTGESLPPVLVHATDSPTIFRNGIKQILEEHFPTQRLNIILPFTSRTFLRLPEPARVRYGSMEPHGVAERELVAQGKQHMDEYLSHRSGDIEETITTHAIPIEAKNPTPTPPAGRATNAKGRCSLCGHRLRRRARTLSELMDGYDDDEEEALDIQNDSLEPGDQMEDSPFRDLRPFLEKTFQLEVPTVSEATSGKCLFYAGRGNALQGDTGVGKTILLMKACIGVINAGGIAVYFDPEDRPEGFVSRMLALGADPEVMKKRLKYLHNPTPEEILEAQNWAQIHQPTIVVLDGLAESLASMELDENSAQSFLTFYRKYFDPFAKIGAAVVIADHTSKRSKARGPHARGTGAKVGRYDGVVYEVVLGKAFSPKHSGHLKLKIAKDRNGGAGARGENALELHLTPGSDGYTIATFKHAKANDSIKEPKLTGAGVNLTPYKDKIMKFLLDKPNAAKTQILEIEGKDEHLNNALKALIEDGAVEVKIDGKRHLHLVKALPESPSAFPSGIVSQDLVGNLRSFPLIFR